MAAYKKWIFLLLFLPVFTAAQENILIINSNDLRLTSQQVDEEQKQFKSFLQFFEFDEDVKRAAENFAGKEIDALQEAIQKIKGISNEDKLKGLRSLQFFLNAVKGELQKKKFSAYKLPVAFNAYKQVLPLLVKKKNVSDYFTPLNWRTSLLLANSFWQFDSGKWLEEIATYKRVKSTPKYILSFLEKNTGFIYSDSLIILFAAQYPGELIYYLKKNNNALTKKIQGLDDALLKQIIAISKQTSASEIAPFTEQLAAQQLTVDSILLKRKKPAAYYQLLVNTVIASNSKLNEHHFQKALQNALHEKALTFYIKEMNELHNETDAVRFASIKDLRPQDLYYIIVNSEQDMYTSTYLGIYRRLMENFKNNADSLFTLVHYNQFRKFLRVAANYNTLPDFFKRIPVETSEKVIHRFVTGINMETTDEDELITDVMDVADAFLSISQDEQLNAFVKNELDNHNNKKENSLHAARIYFILSQAYEAVTKKAVSSALQKFYNYESISPGQLKNKNNIISEVVLFYGDEDGKNSYKSFMNFFKDSSGWKIENNAAWTTITSQQGVPVIIYANLPLDNEEKKDTEAQDLLFHYLRTIDATPSVLIHRGHSYHLSNTLKRLDANTKLAILGSCGGYNNIKQIVSASPDVQIIASKQIGSMIINDPLLDAINKEIKNGNDINWEQLWANLSAKFKDDATALRLFTEYVPPYKNAGVFVYKLYNADQ